MFPLCLIAPIQIAHHQPSIYVLDTPGVLVPSIPDIETGLKLALAGLTFLNFVGNHLNVLSFEVSSCIFGSESFMYRLRCTLLIENIK